MDNNLKLGGFLPSTYQQRPFQMGYAERLNQQDGLPVYRMANYGQNGIPLNTGSGAIWRTNIINWEGGSPNPAANPQPPADYCTSNPLNPPNVCQ